jgi:hypothetical protein
MILPHSKILTTDCADDTDILEAIFICLEFHAYAAPKRQPPEGGTPNRCALVPDWRELLLRRALDRDELAQVQAGCFDL